jgi:CheY-like chemotaxis protein
METSKKRVLVVDDEPGFAEMVAMTLGMTGKYDARQVVDSTEALAVAREFKPHVILLDVMMPDMDGGDVFALLRADPDTRDVPVIFLTALVGGGESEGQALVSGGKCYLGKPFELDQLTSLIEEQTAAPATAP